MAYTIEIEIKHTLAKHWITDDELADVSDGGTKLSDAETVIRELIAEDLVAFFDEIMPNMEITIRRDPEPDAPIDAADIKFEPASKYPKFTHINGVPIDDEKRPVKWWFVDKLFKGKK